MLPGRVLRALSFMALSSVASDLRVSHSLDRRGITKCQQSLACAK
jgi:hypothetical protein